MVKNIYGGKQKLQQFLEIEAFVAACCSQWKYFQTA